MNTISKLQDWYRAQCGKRWEHSYGVRIETLDNPGWALEIDLRDTALSGRPFAERGYGVDETAAADSDEWLCCKVEDDKFVAVGGPGKLEEMIDVFLAWSVTHK